VGRPLSNISTNIKLETLTEDIKKVLSDGCVLTKEIETNNGKFYQVMTMPYIQQQDNKRNGAIITFNDITDLKNAQLALSKTNLSLQRINADLDNFVYIATHDLLSPLSNIEFSIQNMNEIKVTDPEFEEYLSVINSSVKKFSALIKDIAAISKIEADMKDMEIVDIDEILDNVEWALANKIKSTNATLLRNFKIKQLRFSKKNIRSILFNLVSNAIKCKGKYDPLITITTVSGGGNLILSVQDNGIGIEKEKMGKIFDLYGRLHHEIEGQGIGLYLARKIITAAGGTITVESEAGKGSKFIITLAMV
jgi:light-regulated signal transduction histidine kinase (bacteriophytochrome)